MSRMCMPIPVVLERIGVFLGKDFGATGPRIVDKLSRDKERERDNDSHQVVPMTVSVSPIVRVLACAL